MSQCTATAKSTGEQCQRSAINGADVCYVHGGAASQVKKKAQERLDDMADSTTADIQRDIEDLQDEYDQAEAAEEKLAILSEMRKLWKIVLDRTGHGPADTLDINQNTTHKVSDDEREAFKAFVRSQAGGGS